MKKTTKHVKFELPINNNNNKSKNEIDTSLLLLSECKKFPSTDHKFPKISHISLLRQKLHNDINTNAITNVNYNSSKYHPTTKLSSFSSSSSSSSLSLINQSKRFVAARAKTTTTKSIYSTNDKTVNAYLTKSKISSTISPTAIKIKKPYAYATSRISHINTTTIPQSVQKSLQLINCNSIYLRSKLSPPPIDITRKFSTICSKNENSTNIPMQLSMTNMADKNFDNGQYQNDKMEMLQLNIPWRKIFSTAQQNHLTLIDNLVSLKF
ncbi:unnamed protein product [Brugia pahangi]|uniref:Uncharacterized protein n=1 Tax=Brugia pahangi TaxID=6280 RepID=A0A0N4T098_BRUPA|nr:unnamed protein product [Brugia pahangi]